LQVHPRTSARYPGGRSFLCNPMHVAGRRLNGGPTPVRGCGSACPLTVCRLYQLGHAFRPDSARPDHPRRQCRPGREGIAAGIGRQPGAGAPPAFPMAASRASLEKGDGAVEGYSVALAGAPRLRDWRTAPAHNSRAHGNPNRILGGRASNPYQLVNRLHSGGRGGERFRLS
jgi:hypothetical protein